MSDTDIPNFKTYEEGKAIPPVDPEDVKRMLEFQRPRDMTGIPGWKHLQDMQAALSPGADISAVSHRCGMIRTLTIYNLPTPWQHGEELDDAVFRIAAIFPLRELKPKSYMIPGDEHFGFDPNAFVQRLIEETGVSHVWEPVSTRIREGGRAYVTSSVSFKGQVREPDPEREAKRKARDLLWAVWSRFANLDELMSDGDRVRTFREATAKFDNFVSDNVDLVSQVEAGFRTDNCAGLPVLMELEWRAQRGG